MKYNYLLLLFLAAFFVGCSDDDEDITPTQEDEMFYLLPQGNHDYDKTIVSWRDNYGFYAVYRFDIGDMYWNNTSWQEYMGPLVEDTGDLYAVQGDTTDDRYIGRLVEMIDTYFLKNYKDEWLKECMPLRVFLCSQLGGITSVQAEDGTGTIIVMSIVGLLFIGGVDFKYFIRLGIVGVIGVVGLILAAPYRLSRILSFLNPWSDPLGSGFQIIQSLYAIGPGGLFGFGIGNSRQKHFFLPEPQTDFIFSIISEELGFLGCLIIITLFVIICYNGFKIASNCNDLFGKYLAFGIIFQIAFQACLNLMVVVGLIPVTGVTLPFLSYGGSSLLITLCSIGIVLNISRK